MLQLQCHAQKPVGFAEKTFGVFSLRSLSGESQSLAESRVARASRLARLACINWEMLDLAGKRFEQRNGIPSWIKPQPNQPSNQTKLLVGLVSLMSPLPFG